MASHKDTEEPLKAIVFADPCAADQPIDLVTSSNLLNTPVLSWQLAVLARHGVKEAIVLSAHPIESIYEDPLGRIKVTPLSSPSWTCEGDALREVESRDDLRPVDDFILLRCGSLFNYDVSRLVREHKQRRQLDKNWLITTTFRRSAASSSGILVAVDSRSGTLVRYVDDDSEQGLNIDVRAETAALQAGACLDIFSNVLDVGLDVCAPDFMLEFRENFHYAHVRSYITEKLDGGEAEVFGNRMYAHFLNSSRGEYGSRIASVALLTDTTSDVLNGWMVPISESSVAGIVKPDDKHEANGEIMVERSCLGENVSIGHGSALLECVIGNNVKIGAEVAIVGSIVMDNVIIADRSEIRQSIIDRRCTIREDSVVPKGCFIHKDVYIGVGCRSLPDYSLVSLLDASSLLSSDDDESEEEEEALGAGQAVTEGTQRAHLGLLGNNGRGTRIKISIASRIDSWFARGDQRLEYEPSDEEDEIEEEEGDNSREDESDTTNNADVNGQMEKVSAALDGVKLESDFVAEDSRLARFNDEVFETVERAFDEGINVENTTVELKSLKLAYNCSFAETVSGLVSALARVVRGKSSKAQLYGSIIEALQRYEGVIMKFNRDDLTHSTQVASAIASQLSPDGTLLSYVFKEMYEKNMLHEDGILVWASDEKKRVTPGGNGEELLNQMAPFLEWLEDSEEEDDED